MAVSQVGKLSPRHVNACARGRAKLADKVVQLPDPSSPWGAKLPVPRNVCVSTWETAGGSYYVSMTTGTYTSSRSPLRGNGLVIDLQGKRQRGRGSGGFWEIHQRQLGGDRGVGMGVPSSKLPSPLGQVAGTGWLGDTGPEAVGLSCHRPGAYHPLSPPQNTHTKLLVFLAFGKNILLNSAVRAS